MTTTTRFCIVRRAGYSVSRYNHRGGFTFGPGPKPTTWKTREGAEKVREFLVRECGHAVETLTIEEQ